MRGEMTAISREDSKGRIMVQAREPRLSCEFSDCADDRAGITAAMTRPMTSSIIAALIRTVPIRDRWRELLSTPAVGVVWVVEWLGGEEDLVVGREASALA